MSVLAVSDAPVVLTYTAAYSKEQGKNNWYFYEYGKNEGELVLVDTTWRSASGSHPTYNDGEMTPANSIPVGFRFVANEKGMVRLKGSVTMPFTASTSGNGVIVSICKGATELWKGSVRYGADASYNLETSLREGEYLDFKIDANGNNGYDWTRWYPTVEYLGVAFSEENPDKFYQKKNGEKKQLSYNQEKEAYIAEDGLAMISDFNVMPTDEYSVIKAVEVKEEGRHRVLCKLNSGDIRSNGVIVKVYKNGEMIWQQLCLDEEEAVVDVRALCSVGDIIEVEVGVNDFEGYSNYEWSCAVTKYVGTLESIASTSQGANYNYIEKVKLGDMIGATQGTNGVSLYTIQKDKWIPMAYNTSKSRWDTTAKSGVYSDLGGYISQSKVNPGKDTDSAIEWIVPKDGTIKLTGNVSAPSSRDGVVVDIYKNDKLVWSNRVGGTRLVRWDEPYDTAYVQQQINAVTNVKSGDKLVYIFDQWRNSSGDDIDISDFEIAYISGDILSDTTKWKINNSILLDTKTGEALVYGERCQIASVFVNDMTYIRKADAESIFGKDVAADKITVDGAEYVQLRGISNSLGKNILWAEERLVIIHDGLPTFYGFAELGEIGVALEGGTLYE